MAGVTIRAQLAALVLLLTGHAAWAVQGLNIAVRQDFGLSETYVRILTEAYRRAGIPVKFTYLPGGSSLKYSNSGELGVDGEAGRLPVVLKRYPNLRKVEPPIYTSELMLFSRDPALAVGSWEELADYSITTRLGFKAVINRLGEDRLKLVEDSRAALLLVHKGRADIAVLSKDDGQRVLASLPQTGVYMQPKPIESLPVHHLLHERHARLLPRIGAALRAMTEEGTLARMAKPPEVTLTTGIRTPLVRSNHGPGFVDEIITTAFDRIGVKAKVVNVASKLSLLNANNGHDDGLALRIAGLEAKYPNLVRVPEVLMCNEFNAYSLANTVKIEQWSELAKYTTSYLNGWRIFEQNVPSGEALIKVDSPLQLFDMLKKGRTELALYEKWQGLAIAEELGITDVRGNALPIPQKQMFMYLHKRHADLVEPLAQSIRSMKEDRSYRQAFTASLAPLLLQGQRADGYRTLLACQ